MKTRLHELRKEHGLQQADLAALVDVRRETIGNLENGKYNPSLKLARDIAAVFHLPIEDIFIFDDGHISLKRLIACPCCGAKNVIDLGTKGESRTVEREAGEEHLCEFGFEAKCNSCNKPMRISGYISECPLGIFKDEDIKAVEVK